MSAPWWALLLRDSAKQEIELARSYLEVAKRLEMVTHELTPDQAETVCGLIVEMIALNNALLSRSMISNSALCAYLETGKGYDA
jgi:hypothetical protein